MLTAMVVDDEALSARRLERLLLASGRIGECHTFLNPLEAYEFAKLNAVDIAFLDISMPALNGMALSGRLLELNESIRIVFATGYGDYAVEAFDRSALDYLMKPVTAERLNKTLNRIGAPSRGEPAAPSLEVRLFNGLTISGRGRDRTPFRLRSPKTEELFAFLLCKRTVSREEIVDTLWSGLETEKAWKNLNSTLYYIRKAVHEDGASDVMQTGRTEIRIAESGVYCDLYEFERLLKQIRSAPDRSVNLFKQAEALYTGELLKGKMFEWADPMRRQWERHYIELLEMAGRQHLLLDRPLEALHYFKEILKWDAIREDIHYEVIRLHVEAGNANEALRQYGRLEALLMQELGTMPDAQMLAHVKSMMK